MSNRVNFSKYVEWSKSPFKNLWLIPRATHSLSEAAAHNSIYKNQISKATQRALAWKYKKSKNHAHERGRAIQKKSEYIKDSHLKSKWGSVVSFPGRKLQPRIISREAWHKIALMFTAVSDKGEACNQPRTARSLTVSTHTLSSILETETCQLSPS